MDTNARPLLLPNSSDDEDETGCTTTSDDGRFGKALHSNLSSASTIAAATPPSPASPHHYNDDNDDDEDDDDEEDTSVSVNLAKELLRNENAPHDRYGFTYVVFYLLGMTTLLPWNFFITAESYWMYKFRDITNATAAGTLTPTQAGFTSDLSVAASIPSTIFLVLNAFVGHRLPLAWRMLGSLCLILVFFLLSTSLVVVDTDAWQDGFFRLTLGSVVVMNMATAILSGGLFGVSGQFPSEYVTAVISGQALGGIFASLAEIVSLTFGASPIASALVYFTIGNAVLVLSTVCYVFAARTGFFRYYTVERLALVKAASVVALPTGGGHVVVQAPPGPQFGDVLRKMWVYGFAEWLTFAVTLSVYPSVTVLVRSQSNGNGHPWNDVYFVPVVNYLVFNSGDYLGRILAGMIEWPRNKPRLVAVLAVLRIAFVPALLLCNAMPRHEIPTLIHADYAFVVLMAAFSFSNGYCANIAMIWAPKSVHSREREMASSMMAAFLGVGLACGSSISLIMVQLL